MRFVLAFVTAVGVIITLGGLIAGERLGYAAPVTAIAGFFLWRNLRDPEVGRKQGLRAQVTFFYEAGDGVTGFGTFGRVKSHKGVWHVALDRPPERGDFAMHGVAQRGWVWLDQAGLPQRVRINYGTTWKSWPVLSAAVESHRGV